VSARELFRLDTLDARVKLLMLLCLSTASVAVSDLRVLAALLGFLLALLLAGGVRLGQALGKARGALGLVGSLFVLHCAFDRSGAALVCVGGWAVLTWGGVTGAGRVTLRLLILLLVALLIQTGAQRDYLLALNQLGLPYEISFTVLAALRFLPLLRQQAQDVLSAMQMRGLKLKHTSLRHRLSVYLRAALPIVSGAIRRSEQMATAMELRAFRAHPRRTSMRRLRLTGKDGIYLVLFSALFLALLLAPPLSRLGR
jgi:energy-coupling factor transport system permease protein